MMASKNEVSVKNSEEEMGKYEEHQTKQTYIYCTIKNAIMLERPSKRNNDILANLGDPEQKLLRLQPE